MELEHKLFVSRKIWTSYPCELYFEHTLASWHQIQAEPELKKEWEVKQESQSEERWVIVLQKPVPAHCKAHLWLTYI